MIISCTGNPLHGDLILWQVYLIATPGSVQVEMVVTLRSVCSSVVGYVQFFHSSSIKAHAIDFFLVRSPAGSCA